MLQVRPSKNHLIVPVRQPSKIQGRTFQRRISSFEHVKSKHLGYILFRCLHNLGHFLTREHSRAKMAAGPVFSSGSMRRLHLRLLKLSVFLGLRWNLQPKSEAYSQPSLSASSGRCCEHEHKLKSAFHFPQN